MKVFFFTVCFLVVFMTGFSKNLSYPVSDIDPAFCAISDAVVRLDEHSVIINNDGTFVHKQKRVITIFKNSTKDLAVFDEDYDAQRKIMSASVTTFDKNGKQMGKHFLIEFSDLCDFSDNNFATDIRHRFYDPNLYSYPYTVEIECEIKYNSLFYIPNFSVFWGSDIYVENFNVSIQSPVTIKLHALLINSDDSVRISKVGNMNIHSFSVKNFWPVKFQEYAISRFPKLFLKTDEFSLNEFIGKNNSWKTLGLFINEMSIGRNVLNNDITQKISVILAPCKNKRDSIKTIYEFVQKNTRYVNIVYGIGGLQPRNAIDVFTTGYGDCKALSNYTTSLLNSVGIKAHYTLIKAGRYMQQFEPDFVVSQFNHAIVCVPMEKDTIWLECTSQDNPFGFMSDFTDDRNALLVKEDGGELVKTPKYSAKSNIIKTSADIVFDSLFNSRVTIKMEFIGLAYSQIDFVARENKEIQKKYLAKNLNFSNFDLEDFTITLKKSEVPVAELTLHVLLKNYAASSGNLKFLSMNFSHLFELPKFDKIRHYDVFVRNNLSYQDSVSFTFPDSYKLDFVPEEDNIKLEFGEYRDKISIKDNKISYSKNLILKETETKKSEYSLFYKNLEKLNTLNNKKIILVKSE